jgi:hexokinase
LHSPRALSKLEKDAYTSVYRLLENKTEKQTVLSTRWELERKALQPKRPLSREQDREINVLVDSLGTRTKSADAEMIENAAESVIGPKSRLAQSLLATVIIKSAEEPRFLDLSHSEVYFQPFSAKF